MKSGIFVVYQLEIRYKRNLQLHVITQKVRRIIHRANCEQQFEWNGTLIGFHFLYENLVQLFSITCFHCQLVSAAIQLCCVLFSFLLIVSFLFWYEILSCIVFLFNLCLHKLVICILPIFFFAFSSFSLFFSYFGLLCFSPQFLIHWPCLYILSLPASQGFYHSTCL